MQLTTGDNRAKLAGRPSLWPDRGPRSDFAAPVLTYTPDARDYRYSYDTPATEAGACPGQGYTQGRLAAVDEPVGAGPGVGRVALCYDSLGRQQGIWRSIGSKKAWRWGTMAASGLPLTEQADDGFKLFSDYDPAGRLVMLSDATTGGAKYKPIWSATPDSAAAQAMDAAGRMMTETYGQNILAQNYTRDALGLPSGIQVGRLGASPALLFQVSITARTPYGAPKTVVDAIAGGVDHNAAYAYDGAARLTNAILGQGTAAWKFRFEYDGLQNMIGRTQEVPAGKGSLPIQSGIYRYGENGFGPRQLTSVAHDCDDLLNTYQYDGAGRLNKDAKKVLTYDGYDQLTNVTDNGSALVSHAYGYDGLRTYTKGAGNTEQYWFASDDTLQPGGTVRWHYVKVGDRLVARQSFTHPTSTVAFPPAGATVAWWPRVEARAPRYLVTITVAAALLLFAWAGWRRRRPLWQTAPAVVCSVALVLATPGCDDVESRRQGVEDASARRYFHQGVAAGPTLITDGGGSVVDERRFEPFGEPIDARMDRDPYNSLNKERNAETGWSYHGARWMAPQTARWLTPDPPVKAPNKGFMGEPWRLNPYQYGNQSPTLFWDASGNEPKSITLYLGVSENAAREFEQLHDRYGDRVVGVVANSAAVAPESMGYDLRQKESVIAFARRNFGGAGGEGGIKFASAVAAWLWAVPDHARDEAAHLARIYQVSKEGGFTIGEFIISGHHNMGSSLYFAKKGGASIDYRVLADLGRLFPEVAGNVKAGFAAGCQSGTRTAFDPTIVDQFKAMFPQVNYLWGYYEGKAPTVGKTSDSGSVRDMRPFIDSGGQPGSYQVSPNLRYEEVGQ